MRVFVQVEELNSVIQAEGVKKVEVLRAIKDFKKGIYDLQWKTEEQERKVALFPCILAAYCCTSSHLLKPRPYSIVECARRGIWMSYAS